MLPVISIFRDSQKFQLALLGAYIQLLAGLTDYFSYVGVAPIMRTWSSHGSHVLRYIMWAHTTPAMVYLLSMLSDFNRSKVSPSYVAFRPPLESLL